MLSKVSDPDVKFGQVSSRSERFLCINRRDYCVVVLTWWCFCIGKFSVIGKVL